MKNIHFVIKFDAFVLSAIIFFSFGMISCRANSNDISQSTTFKKMNSIQEQAPQTDQPNILQMATFGTGCFWCTEAQFQQLDGVVSVESGYSGGTVENPTYKQVSTGNTGHAEVVQIGYDPNVISYDQLLAAFFTAHDPTTLNRQGADVGTQYRSVIFYHSPEQEAKAKQYIKELNENDVYGKPVVTEVVPFTAFYKAEDYHQNYYNENGNQPYCRMVIQPKLEKFQKVFKDQLKK